MNYGNNFSLEMKILWHSLLIRIIDLMRGIECIPSMCLKLMGRNMQLKRLSWNGDYRNCQIKLIENSIQKVILFMIHIRMQ